MKSVKDSGGAAYIFSSMHVSGERECTSPLFFFNSCHKQKKNIHRQSTQVQVELALNLTLLHLNFLLEKLFDFAEKVFHVGKNRTGSTDWNCCYSSISPARLGRHRDVREETQK